MARNRYELAGAEEGAAPRARSNKRKGCCGCPLWVWILLILVLLFLIAAALGSYFARQAILRNTIYPVDGQRLYQGGDNITEGDMLGVDPAVTKNVARDPSLLWPLGRIPYTLDSQLGCPTSPRCKVLLSAIKEFNNRTCLLWDPEVKDSDLSPVEIELGGDTGCYSSVGYQGTAGGAQKLVLGYGCFEKGIILHEMGHTVGFWHEHNRPDRDQWLKLNLTNVREDHTNSFNKSQLELNPIADQFDVNSIMMYGPEAFSNGQGNTMETHWGETKPISEVWERAELSDADVQRIQSLYGQQCRKRELQNT